MVSLISRTSGAKGFDPDEIRRIVQLGKDRGLIRGADVGTPIEKNGEDATQFAGLRSQWMDVDPATAKRWLENNFRNRPLSDDVVTAYARDMVNGVWIPTHQGIAFNDKDELIDGQHRLSAIVLCGQTVRMMVTFGLPSKIEGSEMTTMDAVDRGRTRSVSDQLKIQHGMKDGYIIAAICASLANICNGERTRRLSVGQTLDIFRAWEKQILWVIARRTKEKGLSSAGVLAGFVFAMGSEAGFDGESSTAISRMFELLTSGEDLDDGTPIAYLRAFLTSDEVTLLTRAFDRGLAELVLQAIYLESTGAKIEKLELAQDGVDYFGGRQAKLVQSIAGMFKLPKGEGK